MEGSGQKATCGRRGKKIDGSAGRSAMTRGRARKVCSKDRSRETRKGKNVDRSAGRSPRDKKATSTTATYDRNNSGFEKWFWIFEQSHERSW
jgi:hypothetical protein